MLAMLQCRLNFHINLFFGMVIFNYVFARQLLEKNNSKAHIQKTHIHIFHNKLLGEVAIILDVVSDSEIVMRAKVILTKNFNINTNAK